MSRTPRPTAHLTAQQTASHGPAPVGPAPARPAWRLRAALVAAVAAAALPAATGVAVAAADETCAAGEFCVWEQPGQQGRAYQWTRSDDDWRDDTWPGGGDSVGGRIGSLWNRNACTVQVYQYAGYSGAWQSFQPGARDVDLSNDPIGVAGANAHRIAC
ncbi:peptidase inhibitor family I36 protein [Allostreptomyces psammosilenae]|uniref:Peptidase inhibitor family I36 n=1 Tax=Allostreptomyces psammosilenae TaxID=1892865 RepID=A0A853AAY5_9ACTN|nr:peptidase inhibitor family I36 protein [Allostreptomyces psammosilenae]NYI07668.1 hypothetical protein [Allostreptomyces psammosilenae]